MEYVWAAALVLLNLLWLLLVVLGLPGNWLMVAGAALLCWQPGPLAHVPLTFSRWLVISVAALAVIGEIVEFAAGLVGAKKAGGTRRGAWGALGGALVGGVVGTGLIPVPVVGSLIGACLGAALGAWSLELSGGRSHRASLMSGMGAGLGRLAGTLAKLGAGIVIWLIIAVAAFWP